MQKQIKLIITLLLLLLLAACGQEEPEEEETIQLPIEYVPFVDDSLGLSLEHPPDWTVHPSSVGVTLATNQSVIETESLADIGEEAFIVIIPGEIDVFNFQTAQNFTEDDVLSALATYKVLLENEGQEFVTVEPPLAFINDNQKMARMVLRSQEDGQTLITMMAVVTENGYMALISAASLEKSAAEMRPIFEKIIESIEVRPPTSLGS
jgi:hypothetical protein